MVCIRVIVGNFCGTYLLTRKIHTEIPDWMYSNRGRNNDNGFVNVLEE